MCCRQESLPLYVRLRNIICISWQGIGLFDLQNAQQLLVWSGQVTVKVISLEQIPSLASSFQELNKTET